MNRFDSDLHKFITGQTEELDLLPDFQIPEEVYIEAGSLEVKVVLNDLAQHAINDDGHTRESLYAYLTALDDVLTRLTGERVVDPETLKTIKASVIDETTLREAANALKSKTEQEDIF